MFCPRCGSTQPDELRFCKTCGANLSAVREAIVAPSSREKMDFRKTWVAEMFMTRDERDRVRGITPEMKRRREIKAGVITASSGVALAVVLAALMEAIVVSGQVPTLAAGILSRLWIIGLIPVMVGLALILNGAFISPRRKNEIGRADFTDMPPPELPSPADTSQLPDVPFSVTDDTTRQLDEPVLVERIKTK